MLKRIFIFTVIFTVIAISWLSSMTAVQAEVQWRRFSSAEGQLPVPNEGDEQTCAVVFDIDQDGKDDFVIGERTHTPSLVWYRFNGERFEKFIIEDEALTPEAGGTFGDIDNDGDLDLILGQDASGNQIWWWENPAPDFDRPWTRRLIKNSGANKHHDQSWADYDGDGEPELLSWNQGGKKLLLFERPNEPQSAAIWPSTTIYTWEKGRQLEGFPSIPVDVDLDGRIDIVGGGRWFKYVNNQTFQAHVIDDTLRFTQCAAGQLVEGACPELVFSPGDRDGTAKWFEWKNGEWVAHELRFVTHGHTCEVRDVDQDGHLDLMIGEMGNPGAGSDAETTIWYGDGQGNFNRTIAQKGQGIHEGQFGDFNGDGRLDLLVKPYNHNSPYLEVLFNQGKKRE